MKSTLQRAGLGVGFPVSVSAMGGHFMFQDDQETPNTLNATFCFETADGKRKCWSSKSPLDHQSRSGGWNGAYGASAVPPAGLTAPATKKPADKQQSLGPKDAKTNTVGNIFYGSNGYLAVDGYDAYKTWVTDEVVPGPAGKASGDHYANLLIAFAAAVLRIFTRRLRKHTFDDARAFGECLLPFGTHDALRSRARAGHWRRGGHSASAPAAIAHLM